MSSGHGTSPSSVVDAGKVPYRRKYTERQRTSQACKKCRSLKRKCSGDRPKCRNCMGYGFECIYSDTYRGKRIKTEHEARDSSHTRKIMAALPDLESLLRRLQADADPADSQTIDAYLSMLADNQENDEEDSHEDAPAVGAVPDDASPAAASSGTPWREDLQLPPLRLHGVLDQSTDIAFAKFVSRQAGNDVLPVTDDEIARPSFQSLEDLFRYPPRDEADKLLDAYFSTMHTAYPFLCERQVRHSLYRVYEGFVSWEDLDRTTLSLLNFLFAIGAYYCNWPYDDHCMYFARGRQLLFDVFKSSSIELIRCNMLGCFYLMIINKPARAWNLLGLVIRSCQNLGIQTDTRLGNMTDVDVEMNRRLWYSAYVLEHLIALQMARQPCSMRDDDYCVPLPSQISDHRFRDDGTIDPQPHPHDDFMLYIPPLIRFSRIIGIVQRELFFVNRPSPTWERTMKLIASIDNMIIEWKASLPASLNFEKTPADTAALHPVVQRQRNFFQMKYHNLRSVIHRPHITLAIMRGGNKSHHREQEICLEEARRVIAMVDKVDSDRTLHWNFPLWQLVPCLMSAATILVVGQKLTEESGRRQELANCVLEVLAIFASLERNSAAGRCAELIRALQTLELKDIAPAPAAAVNKHHDQTLLLQHSPSVPTSSPSFSRDPRLHYQHSGRSNHHLVHIVGTGNGVSHGRANGNSITNSTGSPTSPSSSTNEGPYDQNFTLDLDYLMQLDFTGVNGGVPGHAPPDFGATQFDWGETDAWT
ncbi:hypothetical protein PYCC9005_000591 [Savitreella phatthalungensis]